MAALASRKGKVGVKLGRCVFRMKRLKGGAAERLA